MGLQSAENSLRNFKLGLFVSQAGIAENLKSGLLWYYQLEELTGIRLDSSLNNLTLAETGTVGTDTGVIDLAAKFSGLSTNNLSNGFDSAYVLSDFTFTGWFNITDKTTDRMIQYIGTGVQLEPDEEIGYYTVEGVRLYDVPLNMSILGLEFKYIDEGDMAQDVESHQFFHAKFLSLLNSC